MPAIQRILVVVDPTAGEHPAVERAASLAARTGASLDLFICDYDQYLAGERDCFDSELLDKARRNLINNHLRRLKVIAKRLQQQGLSVAVDACWVHPFHEGIERKVRGTKPDVVFKDTHYHAPLRRSVFSNTDWNLIRTCPAPLWLVKPRAMPEKPRIIAAVDPLHEHDKPAELDHRIIDAAKDLCTAMRGELQLVHAYEIAPALAVSADAMVMPITMPVRDLAEAVKKQHSEAVLALARKHEVKRAATHVQEGPTPQVLVRLTEQLNADLVVLGAVSRSGLRRLFLGSTAEQILDKLPCDMLIIKPAGAAAGPRKATRRPRPKSGIRA